MTSNQNLNKIIPTQASLLSAVHGHDVGKTFFTQSKTCKMLKLCLQWISPPNFHSFINSLINILANLLPDFWKAFFNSILLKSPESSVSNSSKTLCKTRTEHYELFSDLFNASVVCKKVVIWKQNRELC